MNFPFKLRSTSEFDVVGFGTNAIDYLIRLRDYPKFNSKVEFTSQSMQAGGEVASTLVGLQRLGLRTAYAGRFGSDTNGQIGIQSLIDEGVDMRLPKLSKTPKHRSRSSLSTTKRRAHNSMETRLAACVKKTKAPLAVAPLAKFFISLLMIPPPRLIMAAKAKKDGIVVNASTSTIFLTT